MVQPLVPHVTEIETHHLTKTRNGTICKVEKSTKASRKAATGAEHGAANAGRKVFSDAVGLMKHTSVGNSCYIVTLIESHGGH